MWIQTFTGIKFYPLSPTADAIRIEDIAHALAMKCRFGGHCERFYSVAQHSVLVSVNCPSHPLWGLLHDASEAYLPDVCRPIKPALTGFRPKILRKGVAIPQGGGYSTCVGMNERAGCASPPPSQNTRGTRWSAKP